MRQVFDDPCQDFSSLKSLTQRLSALRDEDRRIRETESRVRDVLALSADLAGRLDDLSDLEWQRLAHELVRRVTVSPDGETDVVWAL